MQLDVQLDHILNQFAKLLVGRAYTDRFLDLVKLAVLLVEIIKPDAVAAETIVGVVGHGEVFCARVGDGEDKHVLSDVDLPVEQVVYSVLYWLVLL